MNLIKKINRYLFYPGLILITMGIFFAFADPNSKESILKITAILAVGNILVIHIFERLFPYRKSWNQSRGDRVYNFFSTNLIFPIFSKGIEIALSVGITWLISDYTREKIHQLWPAHWNLITQLAMAVFLCEFFFYWVHRFGHTFAGLWNFHSIHHSVENLYWDNAGRFHPVDLILCLTFYLAPLSLLGPPPIVVGAFLVFSLITGLLEHANVDFEAGPLNFIFNTAQLHRFHHSVDPVISSTNFGKALIIWDVIFRTWFLPKDQEVGLVGVDTEDIPKDFWGQLMYPFRREKNN
jgi:sterol desaturase/sphingolipid hydroxylase (fatty acid hydroxylase superfamily)